MQIAVGGCLAQMERAADHRARALGRRRVRHAQHRVAAEAARAGARATRRRRWSSRRPSRPSRRCCPPAASRRTRAWVSISVGCNNTCTFCIVPSLRGNEKDRRPGDILDEIGRWSIRASSRSRCSARTSTPTASEFGDRLAFGKLLRACGEIEGLERVRFTSPHPRDFTDDVIDGDGGDAQRHAQPAHAAAVRLGRDPAGDAPRLPSRALPGDPGERPRAACRTRPSPPTSSSASPARPRPTSPTPWTSCGRPGSRPPSPSSTRSAPGTPAATMDGQVPREVVQERYERLVALVEQIPTEENEKQDGTVVEVLVAEGEGRKDAATRRHVRPGAGQPARALRPGRRRAPRPGDVVTTRVTRGAPHHLIADGAPLDSAAPGPATPGNPAAAAASGRAATAATGARRAGAGPAGHAAPLSRPPMLTPRRSPDRAGMLIAVVGPTAAGKSDLAVDLALAPRRRGRQRRLHAALPGHGHRHRQADHGRAPRRPAPPARHLGRHQDRQRRRVPGARRRVIDDIEARGRVPVLVGGSGLYVRAALGDLEFPGTDDEIRARLESELAADGPAASTSVSRPPTPPPRPRSCPRTAAGSSARSR